MVKRVILLAGVVALGAVVGGLLTAQQLPTVDGMISKGEYKYTIVVQELNNMEVHWTYTDEEIYFGVKAPAKGWVGIGWRPGIPPEEEEELMKGVDIIIGYVKDGKLSIEDEYGDTPITHKPDTALGCKTPKGKDVKGSKNILQSAGSEAGGSTIVEFKRKLNTEDFCSLDSTIPLQGELYLAYSDSDDYTTNHGQDKRAEVYLNFATGKVLKVEK